MQNSQLPPKWFKPFAADDAAKVDIPVTSSDPTRASQSLGFPPLTMQPPESGGVPPQGEDFNGAMNQIARIAWWLMAGGALPFDNAWTTNAAIGGYPQGAAITSADLQGEWISAADNNTNNPDTVGTGWVPGYSYGVTSFTGLTNANIVLTPAQAAKGVIRLAGALTGNIQIIFPTWLKDWIVINYCTGAFSVTCKTAAGLGIVISQGGASQILWGDGVNLNPLGGNSSLPLLVGPATQIDHALQRQQKGVAPFTANGTWVVPDGVTQIWVSGCGGGGGGGGAAGCPSFSTTLAAGGGGGGGNATAVSRVPITVVPGHTLTISIGGAGSAGGGGAAGANPGVNGGGGGNTSLNDGATNLLTISGGGGGSGSGTPAGPASAAPGAAGGFLGGGAGGFSIYSSTATLSGVGGVGGSGPFGTGGNPGTSVGVTNAGIAATAAGGYGAGGGGGSGGATAASAAAVAGGSGTAGRPGLLIIEF